MEFSFTLWHFLNTTGAQQRLKPALQIHSRYPVSSRSICCCLRSFRNSCLFSTRSLSLANSLLKHIHDTEEKQELTNNKQTYSMWFQTVPRMWAGSDTVSGTDDSAWSRKINCGVSSCWEEESPRCVSRPSCTLGTLKCADQEERANVDKLLEHTADPTSVSCEMIFVNHRLLIHKMLFLTHILVCVVMQIWDQHKENLGFGASY